MERLAQEEAAASSALAEAQDQVLFVLLHVGACHADRESPAEGFCDLTKHASWRW
jgi:hypothetical protein